MKQLTIRVSDAELERRILDLAEQQGLSLNQAAVRLLSKGAGIQHANWLHLPSTFLPGFPPGTFLSEG